jgi:hypothetical protein
VEKTMIDQLNLHYLHAHQIATRVEQSAVHAVSIGATTMISCKQTSSLLATNALPKSRRISI